MGGKQRRAAVTFLTSLTHAIRPREGWGAVPYHTARGAGAGGMGVIFKLKTPNQGQTQAKVEMFGAEKSSWASFGG
jgi:hypothetical protein